MSHENLRRKDLTFLTVQIKLNLCIYLETTWYFESNRCLGTVFVQCHGVYHLQSYYSYAWEWCSSLHISGIIISRDQVMCLKRECCGSSLPTTNTMWTVLPW